MSRFLRLFTKFEKALLILIGSLFISVILLNLEFNFIESRLYDLRMSKGMQAEPSANIALITIDDVSAKQLDEFLPLTLNHHTQLIQKLKIIGPKAIGYLVDLSAVQQNNPDVFTKNSAEFLNTVEELKKENIPFLVGTPYDVTGEVLPPYPLSSLPHATALIHKDGNIFAEDKVTRRALTYLEAKPAFHIKFAQSLNLIPDHFRPRGNYEVPEIESEYFFFRYHGNPASKPYPTYSLNEVLSDSFDSSLLKNKIIFVGTLSKNDSSDFAFSPYSKTPFTDSKLTIHAMILDSVIHNDGIGRTPLPINAFITFLVVSFVIWSVLNTTPIYGVFSTLTLAVFFIVFGQLIFQMKGIWVRESEPLLGIFLAYYLIVPYRLIREYKKRWEYQRKNELLTQVEELKTNFLQLVTHDLKTPVARIQGLSELILRKLPVNTPLDLKLPVQQILFSTEELNRFISSILELSKVESRNIKLYFESKDINDLIQKTALSFQPQLKLKKITLVEKLEPLFPIKVDPSLISKVISNLLDNAIKYSPENSVITITSQEQGDQVLISIEDQGIGLSEEEQSNLFTRFYRAKNDQTTTIPGTGLGLYLTKYFVECHFGEVRVRSEKGKGTCFQILLPIDLEKPIGLTKQILDQNSLSEKETPYV